MVQNMFGAASGGMKGDPAIRSTNPGRRGMAAIDTGPYLRQCGSGLPICDAGKATRQAGSRIRIEQWPAGPASAIARAPWGGRIQRAHMRPLSGVTVWISWLIRWVR